MGDYMNKEEYKRLIKRHKPKEKRFLNSLIAFITGGIVGMIGELLIEFYVYYLSLSTKDASSFMLVTLIFFACLFTSLGFFDKWVNFCKCGLIIPLVLIGLTSMTSTFSTMQTIT